MPKKYVLLLVGALVTTTVSALGAVFIVRRSRTEIPPVSPTVPRVEDLEPAVGSDAAAS
ncbi:MULTISPECIES: hypothetical protein [Gordonia]|uniref:hypothetical protein n=1 Tax=Gordonia TaxID=2053 RepID=UPI000A4A6BCD|nr:MULTISPECIES: hypothetical protein [Gordonia]WLP88485.1 hypothetical protein Q9K23_12675 [Gordonia sp. NB41Y]